MEQQFVAVDADQYADATDDVDLVGMASRKLPDDRVECCRER